ncbi:MAG: NAD(P)/FAD-dependent oxidoreductase [Pirellulales bacterium]
MSEPCASWEVIVLGAGAAGLLAATRAAELGRRVLLVEKNARPGVKILMSGGTRCNLTHATDARGIVEAFGAQGPFLHSALSALGPDELVQLVEAEGVATKIESTGKIFPVSNKATDVLRALLNRFDRSGAKLALDEPVEAIERQDDGFRVRTRKRELVVEKVILATGGQSYPGSGTTGDGYAWARSLGHTVIPPRPALAPLTTHVEWVMQLRGVTVPDVQIQLLPRDQPISMKQRPLAARRGSLLFTHFGLSGPVAMDVSGTVTAQATGAKLDLLCDFLPTATADEIVERMRNSAAQDGKRQATSAIASELPRRLVEALLLQSEVPGDRRLAELSRTEREALVNAVKRQHIPISGTLGFKKAEVTAGGVALDEVDSRTMESKIVPNLFLAGEILDLDGPIGGYNFQSAFSTGWLAGSKV